MDEEYDFGAEAWPGGDGSIPLGSMGPLPVAGAMVGSQAAAALPVLPPPAMPSGGVAQMPPQMAPHVTAAASPLPPPMAGQQIPTGPMMLGPVAPGVQMHHPAMMAPAPPHATGSAESSSGSSMLGVTLAAVALGGVVGYAVFKSPLAVIGGALGGGALINGYRALKNVTEGTDEGDKEAVVSGTYAVAAVGGALYLLYKARGGGADEKTGAKTSESAEAEAEAETEAEATADEDDAGLPQAPGSSRRLVLP